MSRLAAPRPAAVDYPSSDGRPVAESDFQRKPLWYAEDILTRRFRDRDDVCETSEKLHRPPCSKHFGLREINELSSIPEPDKGFQRLLRNKSDLPCVSANLFLYYEEGNPRAVVAPDVFVVLGAPKRERHSYKLWEESKGSDFVLEITSRSTRSTDQGPKCRVYADPGVREYRQLDPTGDYPEPPLQGRRLLAGRYTRLPLRTWRDGKLAGRSEVLGLDLGIVERRLRLRDPRTGLDLPASEELEARAEQEARVREAAQARVAMLEARLRALRDPPPEPPNTDGRQASPRSPTT